MVGSVSLQLASKGPTHRTSVPITPEKGPWSDHSMPIGAVHQPLLPLLAQRAVGSPQKVALVLVKGVVGGFKVVQDPVHKSPLLVL